MLDLLLEAIRNEYEYRSAEYEYEGNRRCFDRQLWQGPESLVLAGRSLGLTASLRFTGSAKAGQWHTRVGIGGKPSTRCAKRELK